MEETVANVSLREDELQHRDVTPNHAICKEIKKVTLAAAAITENPEYVVMHRSIAVQTVTSEEIVIPKQALAHNPTSNSPTFSPEGGNTMEIDVSSQESAMDIASQESLSAKEWNSEQPHHCDHRVVSAASCEGSHHSNHRVSASSHEELLMREEALRKREEALLQCQERVRILEEDVASREKAVTQLEMEIQEREEKLKIREAQLADEEFRLKNLEREIKIRELEAEGYKVIPFSGESNGCLPVKRAKKS